MRCICCDVLLTDYESTRKSAITGEYFDMCSGCLRTIKNDVLTIDRQDLNHDEDFYEDPLNYIDDYLDKNYKEE